MTAFLLICLVVLMMVGIPVIFSIGLSSCLYLAITQIRPLIIIAARMITGASNFALLALPMFMLSGYLMESGGVAKRMVATLEALFGWVPGRMGTLTLICCAFFAALTGSGQATVAAIGAVLLPALLRDGYSRGQAAGLLSCGGALGPIIPPSVCMIIYASSNGISATEMFMGSVVPGLIILFAFIVINLIRIRVVHQQPSEDSMRHYTGKERWDAFKKGFGVLLLPFIVLGGIYGGIFTATEAAVVCVVYCLILGVAYRELTWERLISAFKRTVINSANILIIIAVASVFAWVLSAASIPTMFANAVVPILKTQSIYYVVLIAFLLVIGCFMETSSSIMILSPILTPVGLALGCNPLHLGCIFCITLVIGMCTPPFGLNLYVANSVCDASFLEGSKSSMPYILVFIVLLFLFAFVPDIILYLPTHMMGAGV